MNNVPGSQKLRNRTSEKYTQMKASLWPCQVSGQVELKDRDTAEAENTYHTTV